MCSYTMIAHESRKARKPHKCIWCGEVIIAGTKYLYERCIFEGDPYSNCWHHECNDYAVELNAGEYCWEFDPWQNHRPVALAAAMEGEGK